MPKFVDPVALQIIKNLRAEAAAKLKLADKMEKIVNPAAYARKNAVKKRRKRSYFSAAQKKFITKRVMKRWNSRQRKGE